MALGIVNMPVDAVALSHLDDVSDSTVTSSSKSVTIKWSDPEDLFMEGAILAKWEGTLIVRKVGSAPKSRFDGEVVVDNYTRNQYATNGFVDTGLTNGTIYYYRFFPHDVGGNYRPGTALSAQPAPFTTPLPAVTAELTYDGTELTPELTYDSDAVVVSGVTSATNAGTYNVIFRLISDDYVWSDGSYASKTLSWTINRETVTKPTIKSGQETLVFNSNFQSPELNSFVATKMTQGGQDSRMTVGEYNMTITLSSTNYNWENEDDSVREITLPWSIIRAANPMSLSMDSANIAYGESVVFTVTNPSNGTLSVSSAASDYVTVELTGSTVTVTCTQFRTDNVAVIVTSAETANYNSGTSVFTAILQKANGSLTMDKSTVTLTDTNTTTVVATKVGDGVIQATSSNTNIVTVGSINQTTGEIVLNRVSNTSRGTATITVSVTAGSNHYAPANKTVTFNFFPSFNYMSWNEIATIVKAGQAATYWNVGDTKDMKFSAAITMDSGSIPANTTYKVVILGFNHNSSKEGTKRLHLCIGKDTTGKEICFYGHKMNSSNTNSGGWNGSAMKTWLNGTFYNALPTDLKAVITACTKYTDNTGSSSNTSGNVTSTSQKIWLLAEYEVFGARSYANQYEKDSQAQYDYYKNGNSKVRYGHSGGSAMYWWLRSPSYNYGDLFCYVLNNGNADIYYAGSAYGVVPGFTIS